MNLDNTESFSLQYSPNNKQLTKIYRKMDSVKLKFSCQFHFEKFPFDKHECELLFVDWQNNKVEIIFDTPSFGKHEKNHQLIFANKSFIMLISPATSFKISIKIMNSSLIYYKTYSSTGVKLTLQRQKLGLLLGSFYVPTGIFAILSMASFVIHPDIVSCNEIIFY